jgi:hypothetical protein
VALVTGAVMISFVQRDIEKADSIIQQFINKNAEKLF